MNSQALREHLPYFLKGTLVTVRVIVVGIAASLATGLACAITRHLNVPVAKRVVGLYIGLSHSTLPIVQLFFIYYGLPEAGVVLSFEASAVTGLSFLGRGYVVEASRSGSDSVGMIRWESAQSLGMMRVNAMVYMVAPQAPSRLVTTLVANVILLVKETSVVSVIALNDLAYVAREKTGNDHDTTETLFLLVTFYIAIILPVSLAGAYFERRAYRAEFGN